MTGCLSGDDDGQLEPDAAPPSSCGTSPELATARRACVDHCDAGAAATSCSDRDLYDFRVACREYCVAAEVPEDCVDEAARDWVCLSQVEWACAAGAGSPTPPAAACALTRDVLAACLRGDGS